MTKLCIDIGNTNIACGVKQHSSWQDHWRFKTDSGKTADEYIIQFHGLFSQRSYKPSDIQGVIISSVVPELNDVFGIVCREFFKQEPLFLTTQVDLGLSIAIDNPRELGPDLYANALAGYTWAQSSAVVVDFGTALTFTCIEKHRDKGIIQGVSIAPGLSTAVKALSLNTAQLPHVELKTPITAIGKNTIHSIQSGIVLGYSELVKGLVTKISSELSQPVKVIATGGLNHVLESLERVFDHRDTWLTLEGLSLAFDMIGHNNEDP
jgi:type III pantothenate kinase